MRDRWMIEEVGVGARDAGRPVLWFTVTDGGSAAALQVYDLNSDLARDLLSEVYRASDLNGRLCEVEHKGPGQPVMFVKLLRAARR